MYRMDFWTQRERERVGWFGRMALKHVYYHVRNESPVYVQCRMQDAWGWCTGLIWRDDVRWEGGSCLGAHVHPWRIHVNVCQNQYSIVKLNKVKKKKEFACWCRRREFSPWVWKIPWRRKWLSTPVFLPGELNGPGRLQSMESHRVRHDWATNT